MTWLRERGVEVISPTVDDVAAYVRLGAVKESVSDAADDPDPIHDIA